MENRMIARRRLDLAVIQQAHILAPKEGAEGRELL